MDVYLLAEGQNRIRELEARVADQETTIQVLSGRENELNSYYQELIGAVKEKIDLLQVTILKRDNVLIKNKIGLDVYKSVVDSKNFLILGALFTGVFFRSVGKGAYLEAGLSFTGIGFSIYSALQIGKKSKKVVDFLEDASKKFPNNRVTWNRAVQMRELPDGAFLKAGKQISIGYFSDEEELLKQIFLNFTEIHNHFEEEPPFIQTATNGRMIFWVSSRVDASNPQHLKVISRDIEGHLFLHGINFSTENSQLLEAPRENYIGYEPIKNARKIFEES